MLPAIREMSIRLTLPSDDSRELSAIRSLFLRHLLGPSLAALSSQFCCRQILMLGHLAALPVHSAAIPSQPGVALNALRSVVPRLTASLSPVLSVGKRSVVH
jgi:hypothetical protein